MGDELTIDWSSSEVHDGRLKVSLSDKPTSDWRKSFERTVALLPAGDWGDVTVKKGRIRVDDVAEGSEEALRIHLEGLVDQANATERRLTTGDDDAASDGRSDGVDDALTQRFRAFAGD